MPNLKLLSIQLIASTVCFSTLFPTYTQAASLEPDLELPTAIVRDRLILESMAACKAKYYIEAVYLLENFLNPHRIITTPIEKAGINHLTLTYQAVGQSFATETINRAIVVTNNSPLELATSEYNAGIIAERQNELKIANQHWEKARQLYKNYNRDREWTRTTRKLAQNYRALGNRLKS